MYGKECVLYDNKTCNECGDCNFCDINSDKICDNCGECLSQYDYNGIKVEDLVIEDTYSIETTPAGEHHNNSHSCDEDCECGGDHLHNSHCSCCHDHN